MKIEFAPTEYQKKEAIDVLRTCLQDRPADDPNPIFIQDNLVPLLQDLGAFIPETQTVISEDRTVVVYSLSTDEDKYLGRLKIPLPEWPKD